MRPHHKIVVFDLDETLGCFVEVGIFWDALEQFYKEKNPTKQLQDADFFNLVDTFPEFLRPNIVEILHYLVQKKEQKQCDQIMIYTNNQGPKSWTQRISAYLSKKVGSPVFDQIIAAFKRNGKVVEVGRTTDDKTVADLIRCTHIPKNTEICFLDDRFHPLMKHDKVFYINVKPYTHSVPFEEMATTYYNRFSDAIPQVSQHDFVTFITSYMEQYNYTVTEKSTLESDVDKVISKRIMSYLEDFFKSTKKNRTLRSNGGGNRRTRRHL